MKSYIFFVVILFMCFTSINCKAGESGGYKLKGLNDEIYYKLSGAWDECLECKTDEWEFSWGKGEWVWENSIIIDFGPKSPNAQLEFVPPYLYIGTVNLYKILSIETLGENKYKLNLVEYQDRKKKKYYIIHTNEDGTIWFEEHPILVDVKENLFYRISGPKRPEN